MAAKKKSPQTRSKPSRKDNVSLSGLDKKIQAAGRATAAKSGTIVGRTRVGVPKTDVPMMKETRATSTLVKSKRGNLYTIQTVGTAKNPVIRSSAEAYPWGAKKTSKKKK